MRSLIFGYKQHILCELGFLHFQSHIDKIVKTNNIVHCLVYWAQISNLAHGPRIDEQNVWQF